MSDQRAATTQTNDARMLAACLAGDEDAWTALIERYTRLVYSIAFKAGLSDEDAADVVQNVFTIVLRRLETLQHVDRFPAWLITVTHRESWRVSRSRRDTALADGHDPDPAAEEMVVEWEHASLVRQALDQLGDRCRDLLERLFLRDPRPPYESIASDLGIAVGSIGPIRARCLEQLRGQLGELGIVDSGR